MANAASRPSTHVATSCAVSRCVGSRSKPGVALYPRLGISSSRRPKGDKTAHLFTRKDGKPIALAGLWDRWVSADKTERKETYTVVTTAPSAFAAQFHDR